MSNLTIRDVAPPDFEAWLPLWNGYNAFYGRSGPTALADQVTCTTWNRLLDPREPMYALVAEEDGVLLGLAHMVFHRATTMESDICYLNDLFTAPEARKRGVARRLIEAVYDYAGRARVGRVYWQTHETNATARSLYDQVAERSGFIVYRKLL